MFMSIMSITCSIMFIFMKHPLSMGLTLIIQTMIVALMTGMIMSMFWYSYILLIMMLSGMLVLFIYMASIASNEKFKTTNTLIIMTIISLSSTLLLLEDQMWEKKIWSSNYVMMYADQINSLIKMFNYQYMYVTIMMIMYLLMTMIGISFIVNVFEGPLRMKT